MSQFLQQLGTAVCLELLNRPAEVCSEPRGMIVFGSLVIIMTAVMVGAVAALTWTDPNAS